MTAVVTIIGFALYQWVGGHGDSYYLPKMVCAGYVLLLPAVGLFALVMSLTSGSTVLTRSNTGPGAGIHRVPRGAVTCARCRGVAGLGLAQQWLPGTESRGRVRPLRSARALVGRAAKSHRWHPPMRRSPRQALSTAGRPPSWWPVATSRSIGGSPLRCPG